MKYRFFLLGAALLSGTACNLLNQSAPATPAPSGVRFRMSGNIIALPSAPIAGATLTVLDGSDQGMKVGSDSAGHYSFASLSSGRFNIVIEAAGYDSAWPVVNLTRDIAVDFALHKTGAP